MARVLYFAYGSNMSVERLRARVPSAELVRLAFLANHELRFHKRSQRDGSGKCDAAYTGRAEDTVRGVLYSIESTEIRKLDIVEGRGHGYERRTISVVSDDGETLEAETYIATETDPLLRPFDWYKEHVLRGAKAARLPPEYIALIDAVVADVDSDETRRTRELSVYSGSY
jgi:gamma-glutamylcyclotransferase (GGCT)/AIG2-like uncharacterized protein YtfP